MGNILSRRQADDESGTRAIQSSGIENSSQIKYGTNPNRGTALIINQMEFELKELKERKGSIKDRDRIGSVLKGIGFDVRYINDRKRDEILDTMKTIAKEDHSQNDCLVVVVMTHGNKNILYASDDYYSVSRLWEPFVGDGCKSLVGKPKLFFIQACRGANYDDGVKLPKEVTDTVDAQPSTKQQHCVIPTMADLLVMYSTYAEHYSWRNDDEGSWFIQSLSMELEKNAHKKELLHLLTAVSRRVAYQYQSNVPGSAEMDAKKQMPCIVSTLTKEFYFPPK